MLKIRRPLGRLIFNVGIAIPGKTVFLIETAPCWFGSSIGAICHTETGTNWSHFEDDILISSFQKKWFVFRRVQPAISLHWFRYWDLEPKRWHSHQLNQWRHIDAYMRHQVSVSHEAFKWHKSHIWKFLPACVSSCGNWTAHPAFYFVDILLMTTSLTHWNIVGLTYVVNWIISRWRTDLLSVRCQTSHYTWTNYDVLSLDPLGTTFREIWIKMQCFSFKKCIWNVVCKMSAILFRHQCIDRGDRTHICGRVKHTGLFRIILQFHTPMSTCKWHAPEKS